MKRILGIIALSAPLVAGLLLASALAPTARAWDVYSLPAPCSITSHIYESSAPSHSFTIRCGTDQRTFLYGANDYPFPPTNPNFQSDLDAFVDAHYVPPTTSTTTTTPTQTTTTVATTTVVITIPTTTTTTITPPPSTTQPTDTATTTTTPPTPAPAVSTVTVRTAADIAAALTLIQQRLDTIEARVRALEEQVGLILGEAKNEPPFTNPA